MSAPNIGVDLGSASVDCAIVEKKGRVIQLKEYFSLKKEFCGEDKTTDILKIGAEFENRKLGSSKASISVPDRNFLLITFKLPKLPPKERAIAERAEIEQKLPFPLEEAAFHVMRLNAKEASENEYVAFCTRLADVNRFYTMATNFNLMPTRAMTEAVANLNCAEFNGYLQQKEISYLMLDIGAMHVGFTLVTNGLPWLTFCLAPKDTFSVDGGGNTFDPKAFLESQIHDIGKIISSFEEKSVIAPIRKILLFGKGEVLGMVQEKIVSMTPIPLERVDALRNIEVSEKIKERVDLALISSVAIGLALTSVPGLEASNA